MRHLSQVSGRFQVTKNAALNTMVFAPAQLPAQFAAVLNLGREIVYVFKKITIIKNTLIESHILTFLKK